MTGAAIGHRDERANAAAVGRRRFSNTVCEERAEAAEAGEPHLHADICHRMLAASEQLLGEIKPRADAILMRRDAEDSFELADEVKRRDAHFASELFDRQRRLARFAQKVACVAQAAETVMSQQHIYSFRSTIAGSIRDAR